MYHIFLKDIYNITIIYFPPLGGEKNLYLKEIELTQSLLRDVVHSAAGLDDAGGWTGGGPAHRPHQLVQLHQHRPDTQPQAGQGRGQHRLRPQRPRPHPHTD